MCLPAGSRSQSRVELLAQLHRQTLEIEARPGLADGQLRFGTQPFNATLGAVGGFLLENVAQGGQRVGMAGS